MTPEILSWQASEDPSVVAYVVRWAVYPASIDYDLAGLNVGPVTFVDLPFEGMPDQSGLMNVGITDLDDTGDESDPLEGQFWFDFREFPVPIEVSKVFRAGEGRVGIGSLVRERVFSPTAPYAAGSISRQRIFSSPQTIRIGGN